MQDKKDRQEDEEPTGPERRSAPLQPSSRHTPPPGEPETISLLDLMGDQPAETERLPGAPLTVELPPLATGLIDEWVVRAEGHPNVRRAQLGLDIARLETEKARAGRLPVVDLVGSVSSSHNKGSAFVGSATRIGTTNSASVGVQLTMPLYTGGSIDNRIKETLLLEEKSRNDFDTARRGVALATRQAYLGVQSGQAQVKAFEAAEASSALALEATQLGYRVGVRVNLDVLNAQTQLFQTRRDLSKARYDVLVASLKLRQAAGQLKPEDIPAVDRLLAR